MSETNRLKTVLTAFFSVLSSLFGILALPIILMVICNVVDYITGLLAAPKRQQDLNSYKSIRGIIKKVCMWLLIVVGVIMDELIKYTVAILGITFPFSYLIACIVAIWIICNELLSILENIHDVVGDEGMPWFLVPIIKYIRNQATERVDMGEKEESEEEHNEF